MMTNKADSRKFCFLFIFAVCAVSAGAVWAANSQPHRMTSVGPQSNNTSATIFHSTGVPQTSGTSSSDELSIGGEKPFADGSSTKSEELEEVELELKQLAEQEAAARDIWIGRQRKLAAVQQELLSEDDTLRELQERIQSHLRKIEELQREMERELQARADVGGEYSDAPSQDDLQREIMSIRTERSKLIQRRNRLQRQILAADRESE